MEIIMKIISLEMFLAILTGMIVILLIGLIILWTKFSGLNKKYKNFMQKLGNGKNLEEDLETYMYRVNKVEKQNVEISNQIQKIENNLIQCIQKVGIVRYNAFKDVGSDLSFALALLDNHNNGIVLNGIYAREMSSIYAKPIDNGKSNYVLSEEETQAIKQAMNFKN